MLRGISDARAVPLVGEAIHLDAIVVVERSLRDLNIFAGASPYLCTPVGNLKCFCRAHILTYFPYLCWGVCLMFAQGAWRSQRTRLDAIVVVVRSFRDLNIFAGVSPIFVLLRGNLNFFCRAHILTYCPDLCWGVYLMLAQGAWRAQRTRLDASVLP